MATKTGTPWWHLRGPYTGASESTRVRAVEPRRVNPSVPSSWRGWVPWTSAVLRWSTDGGCCYFQGFHASFMNTGINSCRGYH